MSIWAIVPVKPLRRGKSRLEEVLSEEERTQLNRCMLDHTVSTLQQVKEIEHVLVVSRDPEALAVARNAGARTLLEAGAPHLNLALARATAFARVYAIHGVLILPADLPLLEAEDVGEMASRGLRSPLVVVAPDRHFEGTNGLLLAPPEVIQFDFGPHSFHRHCANARARGVPLEIFERPSIGLDLDLPEDLSMLRALYGFDFVPQLNGKVSTSST